jgi:hypothetical protein
VTRRLVGSWACPSGNACEVYLELDGALYHLSFMWDVFPLPSADQVYYQAIIRPAAIARAREVLEILGRTLVVQL